MKTIFENVVADFKRTDLLRLKFLIFLESGCLILLFPFLPLHMRELGLTVGQISCIQGISSLCDILTPLAIGWISSHLQNVRVLYSVCLLLSAVSTIILNQVNSSSSNVFFAYLAARLLLDVSRGGTLNMFESVNIMTIKAKQADYGIQKVYGSLSGAVFGPLSGYLTHTQSFKSVFLLYSGLQVLFLILVLTSDLKFERSAVPDKSKMEDSSITSENPRMSRRRYWNFLTEEKTSQQFLLLSLILGATWSFTETFIFIHLETVGFTRQDLGQSLVFSTFIGILMSICSSRFLTKFGWQAGISLALVSYSIRLVGYTWIGRNNYNLLALLESLKPLGNPLMMLTTGFFMQHFIQIQDIAIFQSLFGSAYFGLAKGMGSIAGGLAIGYGGSLNTFQVLSLFCFAAACLNFRATRFSDIRKKEKLQQL